MMTNNVVEMEYPEQLAHADVLVDDLLEENERLRREVRHLRTTVRFLTETRKYP